MVKDLIDYSITQLKDLLRERNLPTTGNKADLVSRLRGNDPEMWKDKQPDVSTEESEDARGAVSAEMQREMTHEEAPCVNRELELIRRERDLLQREFELVRREADLRTQTSISGVRSSAMSEAGTVSAKGLKDLLKEFDGSSNAFRNWKQQIELLRDTYQLDDNATRVLISSRLKGKALSWFHSKPEHIVMSATNLLEEMRRMFDHRSSKMILRKEFERRTWQTGETFNEYFHDKIILANQISIDEEEIIDYVIDGIPDTRLRDQTKIQRFKSAAELIEAFENITLRSHPKAGRNFEGALCCEKSLRCRSLRSN